MAAISLKATVLYTCLFIIVRGCSDETCKINLMVQCMGCLLCSVAEITFFLGTDKKNNES